MKELFIQKLTDNGWSNVNDRDALHYPTGDGSMVRNADAYFINQIQPNFQAGLALFEMHNVALLRVFKMPDDFNWLELRFKDIEALLDEIIAMQDELPATSYISLMGGTFNNAKVSLLAWEQF